MQFYINVINILIYYKPDILFITQFFCSFYLIYIYRLFYYDIFNILYILYIIILL